MCVCVWEGGVGGCVCWWVRVRESVCVCVRERERERGGRERECVRACVRACVCVCACVHVFACPQTKALVPGSKPHQTAAGE